jgi:subtilisin family serine protease
MKISRKARIALAATAAIAAAMVGDVSAAQPGAQDKVRMIVAYKAGAGAGARAAIAAAGGRVTADISEVNAVAIEVSRNAAAQLQRSPHVEFVEDDAPRYAFGPAPQRASVSAIQASPAQVVPYGIPMVQADQVSDALAADRKLCIVDSGIDRSHEDLAGINMDGINLSKSGEWFTDEDRHGTHVAGTIVARDNAIGVIGVAPNAKLNLYIAKVFDAGGTAPTSTIIRGMLSCMRAGAHVVSMSLGGDAPTQLEGRVVDLLASRNMLLIAAAGNSGATGNATSWPAAYDKVVSVGAVDQNKAFAPFSTFNADVELAGPGVDVLSTVPMGTGIDTSLTVGATSYPVLPMEGSPLATVTAPLADFGLGLVPAAGTMTGKICLIQRGQATFATKVLSCQGSGGVGAVIYNNVAGSVNGTLSGAVTTIPSVTTTDVAGAALLAQVGQSATLSLVASNYEVNSGTSMATPHVSGVAALVWSYYTQCTAEQIRATLDKSAMDLGAPGRDVHYGFGLVQAKAAYDRIGLMGCGN